MPKQIAPAEQAVPQNITLYPAQRAIVEAFAERTNRKFSNAVQFIIEDWARIADQEAVVRQAVAALPAKSTLPHTAGRKRRVKSAMDSR